MNAIVRTLIISSDAMYVPLTQASIEFICYKNNLQLLLHLICVVRYTLRIRQAYAIGQLQQQWTPELFTEFVISQLYNMYWHCINYWITVTKSPAN